MPGPAPGTGGPGPIAPPPPPVGVVWNPPLAAISSLNVAAGRKAELPREREQSSGDADGATGTPAGARWYCQKATVMETYCKINQEYCSKR